MRRKSLKSFMLLLLLAVGVSSAFAGEETVTTVATFKSADAVTGSAYNDTYGGDDWYISKGGNSVSIGFNKNNVTAISDNLGTGASTSNSGVTVKSKKALTNVSRITFSYNGGSGTTGKIYLAYSTDGSTWQAVSLNSGDGFSGQGADISTSMTFDFDKIESAYYGIILDAGKALSNTAYRFDNVEINFLNVTVAEDIVSTLSLLTENGTLSVTVDDETVTGDEISVTEGQNVSITATPDEGFVFDAWEVSGVTDYTANGNALSFVMPKNDVDVIATFADATIEYAINLNQNAGGVIAADKAKAKAGETVTLTATVDEGYSFGAWTVFDGEANEVAVSSAYETTATFTMPASEVEIDATFNENHTVTYYVAGEENSVVRAHGASLSLDTPEAVNGMKFGGWSTSDDVTAPVFVANNTAVTSDITLYAMFVVKEGTNAYVLVEEDQTDWRGDYLIAYSSEIFANGKVGGTDGLGKQKNSVDPKENLSGKSIDATWGDQYYLSLEAINDADLSKGYVLKTLDGKYNYQTSNKNGLAVSENKSTAESYPISVTFTSSSDVKLSLGGNASGAVFRYNTDGYFRFYKDGGQKAVYLYKKVESASEYSLGITEFVPVSISAAGMATLSSTKALDFTNVEEVQAYTATITDNNIAFTRIMKVPANTGVLVRNPQGESAVEVNVPVLTGEADAVNGNAFVAVSEDIESLPSVFESNNTVNYILNKVNGKLGFYKANGKKVAAGKAYLNVPAAAAKGFFGFGEDVATGIESIEQSAQNMEGSVYNMQGQRVAQPTKGLYIVNGKKCIIK